MGTRYILTVTCPNCGFEDDDVPFAPTCGFVDWKCPQCSRVVNLVALTGITYEDASSAAEMVDMCQEMLKLWEKEIKGHDWAYIGSYVSSTLFPGYRNFWCACRNCGAGRDFYIEPNASLKLPKRYENADLLFNTLERMAKEGYQIFYKGGFFYSFDQFGSGKRNPYANRKSDWHTRWDYRSLLFSSGALHNFEEHCPAKSFIGKIRAWWRKR